MPDNYSQWEAHERKQEAWRQSRPVCDHCGEHIQDDHCYNINGERLCPDCLNNYFREEID